jgi:hypothetical protein
MKKKLYKVRILFLIIALGLLISIVLLYFQNRVELSIGTVAPANVGGIDVVVKINDQHILSDTLFYGFNNYTTSIIKLRPGYHKVAIVSNRARYNAEKEFFIFINQSIVIEFYPKDSLLRREGFFDFRVINGKFYYE